MEISREQFKEDYIQNSGITEPEFDKNFRVVRCECGDEFCKGFVVLSHNLRAVKSYDDLYQAPSPN